MKAKWSSNLDEFPPKVVSNGREVLLDSQNAGDEPFMLASNLLETPNRPGVAVVVDKDRVKGGNYAITRLQADTLILDDGFQYLRLRPLHNILLVDSTNPFNNHEMLGSPSRTSAAQTSFSSRNRTAIRGCAICTISSTATIRPPPSSNATTSRRTSSIWTRGTCFR